MKYKISKFFDKEYPITQYYGENSAYYAQFGLNGHEGVDYGTPNGTPVYAPFDGIILRDTFTDKDYGNFTVVWDSIQNCALWFCHLQDFTTKSGDSVKKGQLLGHTNNTGNSTGPHCHVNFVETDSSGNRLNKDNGNQGFLNLLDYVEFVTEPVVDPRIRRDQEWNLLNNIANELDIKLVEDLDKDFLIFKADINRRKNDYTTLDLQFKEYQRTHPTIVTTQVDSQTTTTASDSPLGGHGAEPIQSPTIDEQILSFFSALWQKIKRN